VTTPTIYEGNNTITFFVDGEHKTATIATGNYGSGSDLATAIRNALAFAKAGSWEVKYSSVISMSIFYESPWVLTGGSYGQRLLDRPWTRDAPNLGYNFLYAPLQGLDMVYLCSSNFITLDNVGPKGASDCLCAIPITVGFGSIQSYSMSNSVYFEIPATTTQSLSFQLRDRDNNLVQALQNVAFTLTID
jgi:hypothetical protein